MKIISIVPAGCAPVYNMSVEGVHTYVAQGGFVVHNCDAARYFCQSHPVTPVEPQQMPSIVIDPLQRMDVQMQRYRRAF